MDRKDILLYFLTNSMMLLAGFLMLARGEKVISGSVIAAGIVGCIVFWSSYIGTKKSKKSETLLTKLDQFGVVNIDERRLLYSQYELARKKTKHNFDIMGFGLRNFIEDDGKYLNEWSQNFEIRILVVNPSSPYCNQRDYEEGDSAGKIRQDVIKTTKAVIALKNPKVKIRWYNAIPTTNILRMDNTMWVGPYFVYEKSRNAFVLTLNQKGILFRQYIEHFEKVWSDPKLSCEPALECIESERSIP